MQSSPIIMLMLALIVLLFCFVHCDAPANAAVNFTEATLLEKVKSTNVFVMFCRNDCTHCKDGHATFLTYVDYFKGKDVFVGIYNIDLNSRDIPRMVNASATPRFILFAKGKNLTESYLLGDGDFNVAKNNVDCYLLKGADACKLKAPVNRRVRSASTDQPLGFPFEYGKVFVLDDSNFKLVTSIPTLTVFVKFFAPWCGHCKSMAPTYIKLAEVFKNDKDVIIAEYDATVNNKFSGEYGVQGYPTLKVFLEGSSIKTPVDYSGGRDLDSMAKFVGENSGTWRQADGKINPSAGVYEPYEHFLSEFIKTKKAERQNFITNNFIKNTEKDGIIHGARKHYLTVFKFIEKKGIASLDSELVRIESILKNPSNLSTRNLISFICRSNIMRKLIKIAKTVSSEDL